MNIIILKIIADVHKCMHAYTRTHMYTYICLHKHAGTQIAITYIYVFMH